MVDAVESRPTVCPVGIPPQPDMMKVVSEHIDVAGLDVAKLIYERAYVATAPVEDKDPYKGWRSTLSGRIIRAAMMTAEPEIDAFISELPNHGENSLVDTDFAREAVGNVEQVLEILRTPLKNPQKIALGHEPRIAEIHAEYEKQLALRAKGKTAAQELSRGLDSLDFNVTSHIHHLNRKYNGSSGVRLLKWGLIAMLDDSYDSFVYPQANMHDDDSIFLFRRTVYMNDISAEGFSDQDLTGEWQRRFTPEILTELRAFRTHHQYSAARVGCPALFDGTLRMSYGKMLGAVEGT